MGLVRNRDTGPEMQVRSLVHRMGYRYRLHDRRLPGKPDMVFSRRKKLVFIHGCYWHRHGSCPLTRLPKSNLDFWGPKLEKNRERDVANETKLRDMGWEFLVIWECQLNNMKDVSDRVHAFLEAK